MSISVCILNYLGTGVLHKVVESVKRQTRKPDEIIVVDNGCPYSSWRIVEKDVDRVVHADNEYQFITGLNVAFQEAKSDHVLFMENDVLLHGNCLNEMFYDGGDITNPILYDPMGNRHFTTPFCFLTACFMMKKSTFDFVGDFDKNLAPAYYEDVDYSVRARKFGFTIKKDVGKAVHLANWSFSKVYSKPAMSQMCKKNFRYLLKKHLLKKLA